jgi:SET domain-containing protein
MALLEKKLFIKKSMVPKAGKGLFTSVDIPKGTLIIQYKGDIKTWKEITENPVFNGYVYYINKDHVIDAKKHPNVLARYANDAKGLSYVEGLKNNCKYEQEGFDVYIKAMKFIPAGSEILVGYGKAYWDAVKHNDSL